MPMSTSSAWPATRSGPKWRNWAIARSAACPTPIARRRPETMEHSNWLAAALVYLGAAIIAVPLAKKLGLGSIIGYLAAGIAIGPFGLGLVRDTESILHVAEFGVVLMLFLIGLELEPPRLWALRRPIFGWGSVQLLGCAAVLGGVALACGVSWPVAGVAALGLALSSPAGSLQGMDERHLLGTSGGHE